MEKPRLKAGQIWKFSDQVWTRILYTLWAMFVISWLLPASLWFTVAHVRVLDSKVGEPILMEVSREIHQPFFAEWVVVVRRERRGRWIVVCPSIGQTDYRIDADLPDPLTLEWWSNGDCGALPPGHYMVTTTWSIYPKQMPAKQVRVESNEFDITL